MAQPELAEGIPPELEANEWFKQNIAPRIARTYWFEGVDGLKIAVIKTRDPDTGAESYLTIKVTRNGYIKSIMKLYPADVERVKAALDLLQNA